MPLGFFLPLPAFVVPHLGRRHVDRGDRGAARRVTKLGVATEIADENDLVDAAHWTTILSQFSLPPIACLHKMANSPCCGPFGSRAMHASNASRARSAWPTCRSASPFL